MWRGLIAALCVAVPAQADTAGEALFARGEGAEVAIGGGDLRMPATRFACAGCHGADGKGRAEGGTVFPPIRWSDLTASGRTAYDADGLARALTDGITPDGRVLSKAMPRFRAVPEVLASLGEHLRTLADTDGAGLTEDEIRVTATGNSPFDVGFAAAAALFNDDGGAFGRRIVMVDAGGLDLAALARAQVGRIRAACLSEAIFAARADGHSAVRLEGPEDSDTLYRLRAAGLSVDPAALAVLHTAPGARPTGPALAHFGCVEDLAPDAGALVAAGHRVMIAVPDREALGWAASSHQPAEAMRGFTLGMLLGRAALSEGRSATLARLTEAVATAPLPVMTTRFPR